MQVNQNTGKDSKGPLRFSASSWSLKYDGEMIFLKEKKKEKNPTNTKVVSHSV